MAPTILLLASLLAPAFAPGGDPSADEVLLEAESFRERGGWMLDTQFVDGMGSPYLLAHGLGRPVEDARTEVDLPEGGEWHLWVRTLDWVARWQAPGTPGRFEVRIDGRPVPAVFGTEGADWDWQDGGPISLEAGSHQVTLRDRTGFDGRCDCLLFTRSATPPPAPTREWRDRLLGLPGRTETSSGYDLVVVGGGYSGIGAALAAARMGCRVALVQNRSVLGGNGSSEVRVWSMGHIRRGRFPRIGEIVEEFCDHATKSPGRAEEFGDAHKEAIVRAEPRIDLYLDHHVDRVLCENSHITAVEAFDTRSSQRTRFEGRCFADCTGHGTVGALAGAELDMTEKGRMGMSNMWRWDEDEQPRPFPETPWALDLEMGDFPYPRDHHGQWFWESGYDHDPILGAEAIRDWNLRAVFGAFQAMKNRGGAADHENAFLRWVAYVGGPRESRRLMGDVVLSQDDIVEKREFPDGCVPSTWTIDLHYPKEQYAKKFPDNPFISKAVHDRRIDRSYGYPVPYRCFYSRNIDNLFMAGRCISVTHEALGTTRVMRTCGMMGEVVGRAASLCAKHDARPRDVYEKYWDEMVQLLELPGKARRDLETDLVTIPEDALRRAGPYGPISGLDPAELEGIVVDDLQAERVGAWTAGTGLEGYVGIGYHYSFGGGRCTFRATVPEAGEWELRLAWQPHENRAPQAPVDVLHGEKTHRHRVDMSRAPEGEQGFGSLGAYHLEAGGELVVVVGTEDAGGCVHADAIQVVRKR